MKIQKIREFFSRHEKFFAIFACVFAVAIFVILCASQISRWSVWFDESFTHYLIKFNFFDIAKWTASDVHPPLFYWVLKIWGEIFGNSDVALRFFSTFCGAIAIVFGFLISRKIFGKKVAYFALPLLVFSPMFLRYGIEMRMYTFVVLLVFAQILVLLKARENSKKIWWIFYGILIALGVYTQYFALFASISQLIWLYLISRKSVREKRVFSVKIWRKFLLNRDEKFAKNAPKIRAAFFAKNGNLLQSLVVAFVIFLPWIPSVLRQFLTVTTGGFWIPPVNFATFPDFISTIFFYQTSGDLASWNALVLLAILALIIYFFAKIWREKSQKDSEKFRENLLFSLCLIVIPALLLFAISLPPMRSYFIDRYLLASAVFVPILVAALVGFSRKNAEKIREKSHKIREFFRRNFAKILLYILLFAAFILGFLELQKVGNFNRFSGDISTMKNLMREISRNSGGEKIAVIADSAWTFYDADVYESAQNPVYFLDSQVDDYYFGSEKMLRNAPEKIANLTEFFAKKTMKKFWYVSTSGNAENPPKELGDFAKNLTKIREEKATAPNGWKGSSEAILYEIR